MGGARDRHDPRLGDDPRPLPDDRRRARSWRCAACIRSRCSSASRRRTTDFAVSLAARTTRVSRSTDSRRRSIPCCAARRAHAALLRDAKGTRFDSPTLAANDAKPGQHRGAHDQPHAAGHRGEGARRRGAPDRRERRRHRDARPDYRRGARDGQPSCRSAVDVGDGAHRAVRAGFHAQAVRRGASARPAPRARRRSDEHPQRHVGAQRAEDRGRSPGGELLARRRDPVLEQHRHRAVRDALLAARAVRAAARRRLRDADGPAVSRGGERPAPDAPAVGPADARFARDGLRAERDAPSARECVRRDRERRGTAAALGREGNPRDRRQACCTGTSARSCAA